MKKLKLQIENLVVESFQVSENRAGSRGTVAAHMPKPQPGCSTIAETQITGPCCDITLALSCVQTNCLNECGLLTVDPCAL
jgi:hypothetical protein